MQRLQDRVAVITGAASGIGLAAARRLAAEGAHVVVADVNDQAGKEAADAVGGLFVKTRQPRKRYRGILYVTVCSAPV